MSYKNYYIGIYGTAHETIACAVDEEGQYIGEGKSAVANIHFSIKHAWENILEATQQSLKGVDTSNSKLYAGIGIKNTELIESCQKLLSLNKTFCEVALSSDAHVLCLGINNLSTAVIIADEGLVGNVIVEDELIKIGGWGFPHADVGSIPWIGLEALQLTLQWIDSYIEETPLIKAIYGYFENDTSKLISWAMESRTNPQRYGIIANIVFEYVNSNDKNALKLIKKSANEIEKIYSQLCKKAHNENLPCAIIGPLANKVHSFLPEKMLKNMIQPSGTALDGAIKLIKLKLGNNLHDGIVSR